MHFDTHEKYMQEAISMAKEAFSCAEIPVGCVIVLNGEIVAKARNTVMASGKQNSHAELTALESLAESIDKSEWAKCTLYTTLEPCGMCAGAIAHYGVGKVVFGAYDREYGCMFSKINLPRVMGQNVKCIGGVLENECKEILDKFFARLRN